VTAAALHHDPPMTLGSFLATRRWVLPLAISLFLALAVAASFEALPWDEPITEAAVEARTEDRDDLAKAISTFGSTQIVLLVAAIAAFLAWSRCPRLAIAIIVIALARPLTEFAIKELVARDRPDGFRLVPGRGYSFPSGHPLATAASWGLLPLVAALYTHRRVIWWSVAITVWTLAVLVGISRVWLGVHYATDVVAGLLLAVIGVAGAERFIMHTHGDKQPCAPPLTTSR